MQAPGNPGVADHNSPQEKLWLKLQSSSTISSRPCDFHPPGVVASGAGSGFSILLLSSPWCWDELVQAHFPLPWC